MQVIMASKDKFRFISDGDTLTGDDVDELLSFPMATALGYVLDGLSTTSQQSLYADLFTSDTAEGTTNMTYDAGNDRYNCDTGSGTETCVLTTAAQTIASGQTAVIVSSIHTTASTTTITVDASFDSGSNWTTVTERLLTGGLTAGTELMFRYTFARTNTSSTDHISGVAGYHG